MPVTPEMGSSDAGIISTIVCVMPEFLLSRIIFSNLFGKGNGMRR